MIEDSTAVNDFLACPTPEAWICNALDNVDILLVDHANCEKKAASTAMNLMYRYVDHSDLLTKMSQLAREELLHFEQVVKILEQREIPYTHVSPSRYAGALRELVRTHEPFRLIDILIVGAFVEARSCERFAKLAPSLDSDLAKFYRSLLRSEARHFEDYLHLAEQLSEDKQAFEQRVQTFRELEAQLIRQPDTEFRFHSGPLTKV